MSRIFFKNYKAFGAFIKGLEDADIDRFRILELWINTSKNSLYDKQKIISYLENATFLACAISVETSIFTDKSLGTLTVYTDGEWRWSNSLPIYILHHHVCIPDEWLAKMKRLHYIPLPVRDGYPTYNRLWIVYILKHIPWFFKWLRAW